MIILSAFVIGLAGSFHCVGMCGPIALALPLDFKSRSQLTMSRVVYNLGRVVTYSLMGAVSGVIGQAFFVGGYQRILSIILGTIILLAILIPTKYIKRLFPQSAYDLFFARTKNIWNKFIKQPRHSSLFVVGFLNGFLPCGLVYFALAGAATTGSPLNGFLYMAMFGLGTFPIMVAVSLAGKLFNHRIKSAINRLLPVGAVLLGAILILRGLSLGIPLISPKMEMNEAKEPVVKCCDQSENSDHELHIDSLFIDSLNVK